MVEVNRVSSNYTLSLLYKVALEVRIPTISDITLLLSNYLAIFYKYNFKIINQNSHLLIYEQNKKSRLSNVTIKVTYMRQGVTKRTYITNLTIFKVSIILGTK